MRRTMRKGRTALCLLSALLFTLSGCGNWELPDLDPWADLRGQYAHNEKGNKPVPLQEFVLPCILYESTDPITCPDGAQLTLSRLLYEGLFRLDAQFTPQPCLASAYSYDPATFTYTITLRDDAVFSDGAAVTARDVVNTLQRARYSERYGARLAQAASITASGDSVSIRLSRDNRRFIALLDIPIVRSGTERQSFPIGSGLYCYVNDHGVEYLAPNSYRDGYETLPLQRIGLKACKSSDAAAYAFSGREAHLLFGDLTATAQGSLVPSGSCTDACSTVMQYVSFNCARPPLDDAALRRALAVGIDRSDCVQSGLLGHASAAADPVPPCAALCPSDAPDAYDVAAYTAALTAAGYGREQPVELTLLVNSENSFKCAVAEEIAHQLSVGGISVTVSALRWEAYCEALQSGDYDLCLGETKLTADWDLTSLLKGDLLYSGFVGGELPDALDAYLQSDDAAAGETFAALCAVLREKAPFTPVCFKNVSLLLPSGTVTGTAPTAGDPFAGFADWKILMVS